ncbi:Ribonuclease H domain [Sesbania bispinosa]|nr:Ribonuclease H domain [Sesbania bispinosa]
MVLDSSLLGKLWWKIPPMGFSKLNVDGSLHSSDGSMGSGGVLRSSTGAWIWGFSGFHGTGNVVHAELLALRIGLLHVWDTGFRRIHYETDSLEVIHLLQNNPSLLDAGSLLLLDEIRELLRRPWEVYGQRSRNRDVIKYANEHRESIGQEEEENDRGKEQRRGLTDYRETPKNYRRKG